MPSLDLYRIFVQVAKEKNITKASEKLFISQPAVTRHIKNLEKELNMVLFNRTKGMELTENGKKLYEEISTIIEQIVDIDNKYSKNNEIVFATYSTMLSRVLSGAIADFYSENPNTKIITITDNSRVLNTPLNNENFDLAVLRKFDNDEYDKNKYEYIKLGIVNYVLIANKKSKLSNKKVRLNDLENCIIYIPRGDNYPTKSFSKMIEDNGLKSEIKRIDSLTMSNIIQQYDDCVGEANCKYFENEISNNLVSVLKTEFEIPPVELGIYYRKDNASSELKDLIKKIQFKWNYNKKL